MTGAGARLGERARIAVVGTGPAAAMRASVAVAPPPLDSRDALVLALSEAAGVAPDLRARPGLVEPLLFGPLPPPRYRLDGPGAQTEAEALLQAQRAASPRPPVKPDGIDCLPRLGLGDLTPAA